MRVELNVPESVREPRMWVKHQPVLGMALRAGSIEVGLRRSEMIRVTYDAGEMCLVPNHLEKWFRNEDLHGLCIVGNPRSEEHTSELQSHLNLVCRLLLEKKKKKHY